MKNQFQVFKPKSIKLRITPNLIVYGLGSILLVLLAFEEIMGLMISWNHPLLIALTLSISTLMLYYSLTSMAKYEPLDGYFYGLINFKINELILNEKIILLKEIERLEFYLGDFYGYIPIGSIRGNFNPVRSQGVGNYVEITHKTLKKQKIYFRLENNKDYRSLFPFIEMSIIQNKISFLRGIELLEISDYDQIQAFKKKIGATIN